MKVVYLNSHKLNLSQLLFNGFWQQIKNELISRTFSWHCKNIYVFPCLLSISVLVMYVLYTAMFAAPFTSYEFQVSSNMLITFFIFCENSLTIYILWTDFVLTGLSKQSFNPLIPDVH